MATTDLRAELQCSVCKELYKDPVTLPCGHNFCLLCIHKTWNWQREIEEDPSCPECRERFRRLTDLRRNRTLCNIVEHFLFTNPEQESSETICIYCNSPVSAACQGDISLCDYHFSFQTKSAECALSAKSSEYKKCSVHQEELKYYCSEDGACVCASCFVQEHRGHRVKFLNVASVNKRNKLGEVLEKLILGRKETEIAVHNLKERWRELYEKAANETERVTSLFREINEKLKALEKQVLGEISRQEEKLLLPFRTLIQQLETKKDELSMDICHIEELSSRADPITILQGKDPSTFANHWNGFLRNSFDISYLNPSVWDLDVGLILETLHTGLAGIYIGLRETIYGQQATDMSLDINTASNHVVVLDNKKTFFYSETDQLRPETRWRFQHYQILSSRIFSSGQHYWEVESSESGQWDIGVAYPSIERKGIQSYIGYNNKSWCLGRVDNKYSVTHDSKEKYLAHLPSCERIRITLDYEAGRLSFYELSDSIRHLYTFTATFTEPLHAAFWVGEVGRKNEKARIRILS